MSRTATLPRDLSGLLGETAEAMVERLGAPVSDRRSGEDRWMVYEGGDWSLRIRLRPGAGGGLERVRSWTGSFEPGFESLSSACRALGIRPASPAPEDYLDEPTVQRRALPDPRSGAQHTLTARWRGGRLRSLTAFDEPPDWRGEGEAR